MRWTGRLLGSMTVTKRLVAIVCIFFVVIYALVFRYGGDKVESNTKVGNGPQATVAQAKDSNPNSEAAEKPLEVLRNQFLQQVEDKDYYISIYLKHLETDIPPLVINNEKIRSASMIKLFIMAETFRQEQDGLLNLDEIHTLTAANKVGGAGVLQGWAEGTRLTLRELIDLMITESDNTATNMVIDRVSERRVNDFIVSMGFQDTVLQRKMMDWEAIRQGKENYSSVRDIGVMLEKLYGGKCVGPEQDAAMIKILLRQTDNDKIPALLPEGIKIAHKTGELISAYHDGGIIYGKKQKYVLCIMTEGAESPQIAIRDIADISRLVYKTLDKGEGLSLIQLK